MLLATAMVASPFGPVGPASAAAEYDDGAIQYSTVVDCFGIIQGTPYTEFGAGATSGSLPIPAPASRTRASRTSCTWWSGRSATPAAGSSPRSR